MLDLQLSYMDWKIDIKSKTQADAIKAEDSKGTDVDNETTEDFAE